MNFWTLLCLVWKLTRNVKESIPSGDKKSFDPCPSWIHWNAMFYSLICIILFFHQCFFIWFIMKVFFPSKFSHSFKDFVFQFEHFFYFTVQTNSNGNNISYNSISLTLPFPLFSIQQAKLGLCLVVYFLGLCYRTSMSVFGTFRNLTWVWIFNFIFGWVFFIIAVGSLIWLDKFEFAIELQCLVICKYQYLFAIDLSVNYMK